MKKFLAILLILGAAAVTCFAQQVSIAGRVTDADGGAGLPGTVVRLAVSGLETETDADGYYALGEPTKIANNFRSSKAVPFPEMFVSGGNLLLNLPEENNMVHIGVYDIAGRFVSKALNKRLNKGSYSVRIDEGNLSSQLYIVKVTINGIANVIKFQPFTGRALAVGDMEKSGEVSRLEKMAQTDDTIKVTKPGYSIGNQAADVSSGIYNFELTRTSTWDGDVDAFWGDMESYPSSGVYYVILNRTNGVWPDNKVFWSNQQSGTKVALSEQSQFKLPGGGGRFYIWIAPNDSSNRYFDFMEHNSNGTTSWLGNTTRVDGWRLPISFRVHTTSGEDRIMGDSYEMFYQSRQSKFDEFINEVGPEFVGLATRNFANIYAPHTSPTNYFGSGGPYEDYFTDYQAEVKAIHPEAPDPTSTRGIFGCFDGGMGSSPTYCAGVNRHVVHLENSDDWREPDNFYKEAPCNYFSKWTHRRSIDNLSYGFPYDDVYEQAAFVGASNVLWVAVAIGW